MKFPILAISGGLRHFGKSGWGWLYRVGLIFTGGAFPLINRIDWIRFHNTFSKQLLLATYSEIIPNFFSSPNVIYKMSSSTRKRRAGNEYSEANLSDEIELINNHLLKNLKLSGGVETFEPRVGLPMQGGVIPLRGELYPRSALWSCRRRSQFRNFV